MSYLKEFQDFQAGSFGANKRLLMVTRMLFGDSSMIYGTGLMVKYHRMTLQQKSNKRNKNLSSFLNQYLGVIPKKLDHIRNSLKNLIGRFWNLILNQLVILIL